MSLQKRRIDYCLHSLGEFLRQQQPCASPFVPHAALLLWILLLLLDSCIAQPSAAPSERTILIEFYTATNGPSWYNNSGWGTSSDHCTWYGVGCTSDKRVELLDLDLNNMSGTLPESLGKLGLDSIFFRENNLTGTVPISITNRSMLRIVYLRFNQLSGTLPAAWGGNPTVDVMSLENNMFSGTLPSSWGTTHLRASQIRLNDNMLTGSLPDSWSTLPVTYVYLQNNKFTGTLPSSWHKMPGLRFIKLDNNHLSGTLPAAWGLLQSNLVELKLNNNHLSGSLPQDWSSFTEQCQSHRVAQQQSKSHITACMERIVVYRNHDTQQQSTHRHAPARVGLASHGPSRSRGEYWPSWYHPTFLGICVHRRAWLWPDGHLPHRLMW